MTKGIFERKKINKSCGEKEEKIEGHHENYNKPLDVQWLCIGCHLEKHGKKLLIRKKS